MVLVARINQKLHFKDRRGDETLFPSPELQAVSARVMAHPYFLAAIASKWVTDLKAFDDDGTEMKDFDPINLTRPRKASRKA